MDYVKLYNIFLEYFKNIDILERIKKRNINDFRLNKNYKIY